MLCTNDAGMLTFCLLIKNNTVHGLESCMPERTRLLPKVVYCKLNDEEFRRAASLQEVLSQIPMEYFTREKYVHVTCCIPSGALLSEFSSRF